MKFVDEAKITVEGGAGGNGCVSFRREKFVPRGGPDGGHGGNGGSVYLVGSRSLQTLYDFKLRPHYRAGRGLHGKGSDMHGRNGNDVHIKVPLGLVVYEGENAVGEILTEHDQLLVARGGKGGRGNSSFATASNKAPRIAEPGEPREKRELRIVLKIISDVGIVGFPNAGKSTLLKAITNAQPGIAAYPFTTLTPNLGVLKQGLQSIVLADMPGIIEGAHAGKGLGLTFLRHIERTKKLIILIDVSTPDPMAQYNGLLDEFRRYDKRLLEKPKIVVFNKIDLLDKIPEFKIKEKIWFISALKRHGLETLIGQLMQV
jgi:GTP-binding protein